MVPDVIGSSRIVMSTLSVNTEGSLVVWLSESSVTYLSPEIGMSEIAELPKQSTGDSTTILQIVTYSVVCSGRPDVGAY